MQKDAPSLGRILTMVVFALSCFGLLLFLWLSFGGPIPLKPEGYRFKVAFPEAATLAQEADVRLAGVAIGKVKTKELDKGGSQTVVEIEIDERYAPIPEDSRAILRQKTLLGETFVELTPGSQEADKLAEGARLADSQIEQTVELDELLRIFSPETQDAFGEFVDEQAKAIDAGTAQDLNDALGNLRDFAVDGSDVLRVLDEQEQATRRLIRNTGIVFGALNEQEGALGELIVNSNNTFEATASEQEALAQTFAIFPTFLRESRLTLDRLEKFSLNTNPLVTDLKPVADALGPTVRDLGDLSPDLEQLFIDLNPLIDASVDGLPAAARFLRGARPLFRGIHTFLPELNPILAYLNYAQEQFAQFLTSGGLAFVPGSRPGGGPHGDLPQFASISNSRSLSLMKDRPVYERGYSYPAPNYIKRANAFGGPVDVFDCNNETRPTPARFDPVDALTPNPPTNVIRPGCFVAPDTLFSGTKYPRVEGGNIGAFTGPDIPNTPGKPIQNDASDCAGPPESSIGNPDVNPVPLCSETRSAP